ncbi:ArsR/SmtB family transcription factor [Paracoccus sanguinis]|uniref:ArsR/SmtB family transcription factor n=1 Tax=Paracoccus sanguinis TaxID=1545044 RepID=UPI0014513D0E|nr:helix-turn-helix transcriptional regulator [Paracoccus sanguinis]
MTLTNSPRTAARPAPRDGAEPVADPDLRDGAAPNGLDPSAPASNGAAPDADKGDLTGRVGEATALLKALAHDGRLMILCHLAAGERSVGELEALLDQRQATVSQQLARLREDGLVQCRAHGKSRLYSIADPRAARVVELLYGMFCRT